MRLFEIMCLIAVCIYQPVSTVHKNLGITVERAFLLVLASDFIWYVYSVHKVIYMYISNLHKCILLLNSIDQEVPTEDIKYPLTKSTSACHGITSVLSIVHTYCRSNRANAEKKND